MMRLGASLARNLLALAWVAGCSSEGSSAPSADPPRKSGLPAVCTRGPRETQIPDACNGAVELCSRAYDRVVVPMTHNAMSNADDGWVNPDQAHGLQRQLDDGVRGMMLDTHYRDAESGRNLLERHADVPAVDEAYLCHGLCVFGNTRLLDGLCTITRFLDTHPGEVFSIIFQNEISDEDTDVVVRASGLSDYVYTHPPGAPWPMLGEMVRSGARVVLFAEKGGGKPSSYHPAWENIWDTPYAFATQSDFSCALNRGTTSNALFLINHWLSGPTSGMSRAQEANAAAVLGARVEKCTSEAGRSPTFVGVDFYDVGDLFSVVRAANGL